MILHSCAGLAPAEVATEPPRFRSRPSTTAEQQRRFDGIIRRAVARKTLKKGALSFDLQLVAQEDPQLILSRNDVRDLTGDRSRLDVHDGWSASLGSRLSHAINLATSMQTLHSILTQYEVSLTALHLRAMLSRLSIMEEAKVSTSESTIRGIGGSILGSTSVAQQQKFSGTAAWGGDGTMGDLTCWPAAQFRRALELRLRALLLTRQRNGDPPSPLIRNQQLLLHNRNWVPSSQGTETASDSSRRMTSSSPAIARLNPRQSAPQLMPSTPFTPATDLIRELHATAKVTRLLTRIRGLIRGLVVLLALCCTYCFTADFSHHSGGKEAWRTTPDHDLGRLRGADPPSPPAPCFLALLGLGQAPDHASAALCKGTLSAGTADVRCERITRLTFVTGL